MSEVGRFDVRNQRRDSGKRHAEPFSYRNVGVDLVAGFMEAADNKDRNFLDVDGKRRKRVDRLGQLPGSLADRGMMLMDGWAEGASCRGSRKGRRIDLAFEASTKLGRIGDDLLVGAVE
jgi:hypothetical protein